MLQALSCCALYHLFVANGRLLLRLEALEAVRHPAGSHGPSQPLLSGLPKGSVLPDFSLEALDGDTVTLSQHRGQRLLLVFVNLDCSFCRELLVAWSDAAPVIEAAAPSPLVLCSGEPAAVRRWFEEHPLPFPVLLDEHGAVSSLLEARATPTGYLVAEDGATSSELLTGGEELSTALAGIRRGSRTSRRAQRFSRSTSGSRLVRDGLKQGAPAPPWSLPDLEGQTVSSSDFHGSRVLLVFSDPQCGPCEALVPKLERRHRRFTDPAIVMISRGDLEENRRKAAQHELSFKIVLQRHWEISRAYGMFATPIGYLIDRTGTLASGVAVGEDAILRLLDESDSAASGEPRMKEERRIEVASEIAS